MKLIKLPYLLIAILFLGLSACERSGDDDDSGTADDDDDSGGDDDDTTTDDDDTGESQIGPHPSVICGLDGNGDGTTEASDLPVGQDSALAIAEAVRVNNLYQWIDECFIPHTITLSAEEAGGWLLSTSFTQVHSNSTSNEAQLRIIFGATEASTLTTGEWTINDVRYVGRLLDETMDEQNRAVDLHLTASDVFPATVFITGSTDNQFSGRMVTDIDAANYATARLVFRDIPLPAPIGDDDDSAGDDDDSVGDDDDSTPPGGSCASYVGQATAAEIQATPRTDINLEALAISMAGTLTAPQAVYDRVVTDIGAIRAMMSTIAPGVSTISYRTPDDMRSLMMGFDSVNMASVQAGTYTDWDCPNQWYEMQQIDASSSYVLVEFEGIYNIPMLAAEYGTLLGVQYAEPNSMVGGGGTICGTIDGDTWHFVLVNCLNPSPAGCIGKDYYYFTTTSTTAPVAGGEWSNSSGTAAPAWQTTYACY